MTIEQGDIGQLVNLIRHGPMVIKGGWWWVGCVSACNGTVEGSVKFARWFPPG